MQDRFILQPSQEQGFLVATDKENGIVIRFREHQFNDTQDVTRLDGDEINIKDVTRFARYMREIADWLRKNHYDKIF